MKVAVVFTGFFRTFHFTKQSFKNCIMDPLDADIFFSTPKTLFTLPQHEDPIGVAYVPPPPNHLAYEKLVEPEIIDFFGDKLKSYELIDYDARPYKQLCRENKIPYHTRDYLPSFRILSQINNKELSMKVFQQYIEKHKINYDLVIMTRGDLKYFTPFDFNLIDLNRIIYPNNNIDQGPSIPRWCPPSDKIPKAFNDQFIIGSQNNMLIWCNVTQSFFEYFDAYASVTGPYNLRQEGLSFTAENIMAYHLMQNNIDWYGSNYIEYELCRPGAYSSETRYV